MTSMNMDDPYSRPDNTRYFALGSQASNTISYRNSSDSVGRFRHAAGPEHDLRGNAMQVVQQANPHPHSQVINVGQYGVDVFHDSPFTPTFEGQYTSGPEHAFNYDYDYQAQQHSIDVPQEAVSLSNTARCEMHPAQFAVPQIPASQMLPKSQQSKSYQHRSLSHWPSNHQNIPLSTYANQEKYIAQPNIIRETFPQYQARVRTIFSHVTEGRLVPVGPMLLSISHYLLDNIETLGLDKDNQHMHGDRIKLWNEFNNCWLTTLQKQLDMTHEARTTDRMPTSPQTVMDAHSMETLGQELVRLCDVIEKYGLVDYQMGVAEEQILELLIKCLNSLASRRHSGSVG